MMNIRHIAPKLFALGTSLAILGMASAQDIIFDVGNGLPAGVPDLPEGASVTISFTVSVPDPLPAGVDTATTFGQVAGANFAAVATNDPKTATPNDPTITVLLQPPVAICQDVTATADLNCMADVLPVEVDNGSFDPDGDPLIRTLTPPGPYPLGITTVVLTVTDTRPESATCEAKITVIDTSPPQVFCPLKLVEVAGPGNQAAVPDLLGIGFVGDNCTTLGNLVISQSPPAGALVGVGDTNILLKATDEAGNSGECTTVLTVIEPTPTPSATVTDTLMPTDTPVPPDTNTPTVTNTPVDTTTPTDTTPPAATPTTTETPILCTLAGPCVEAATICINCTGTFVDAGFLDLVVSLPPFNPITACGPVDCGTPIAVCNVICPASLTVDCTAYAQLLAQDLINCINVSMNGFVCATGAGPGKVCIQSASDLTYCLCSSESLVCGPLYHPLEFCPAVNLCDGITDNENPSNSFTAGLSISYQDKPCPGFVTPTPTTTETAVGPTETGTQTQVGAPTSTNTAPAPTNTPTPTQTQPVPADSPTPTATQTQPPADTETPTATETNVDTQTATQTQTEAITPTASQTDVPTRTVTPTPTNTSGVVLTDCDLNNDDRVDAFDLLLLLESSTADEGDFLILARCWYEDLGP